MVGLNPSRFYGRLLPRPRIYCDVKFSDARVDPPESVNAALLEWAGNASWKMGGTAAKRKRMSGKIEGRMSKLRAMEESEEDEPSPPVNKVAERKALGFGKRKGESPASVLASPVKAPESKRGKLVPRRIMSSPVEVVQEEIVARSRARRTRKEQAVEESSDDDECFLKDVERTPPRSLTKSARPQGSPTATQTPDSKRRPANRSAASGTFAVPSSLPSPGSQKRKRVDEDSRSDSDSRSEKSDSVYL